MFMTRRVYSCKILFIANFLEGLRPISALEIHFMKSFLFYFLEKYNNEAMAISLFCVWGLNEPREIKNEYLKEKNLTNQYM